MPHTVSPVLTQISDQLKAAEIDTHRIDARNLVSIATGIPANQLVVHSEHPITDEEFKTLGAFVQRRLKGEPVSRIRGEREFWGLPFMLSHDTLDPRPDSETLVSAILAHCDEQDRNQAYSILDLGTGTGCLLLSLLSELENANGIGVDASEDAIRTAMLNADHLGLEDRSMFVVGDWAACLNGSFDIVICNPPYIRTGEIEGLDPGVRNFDPGLALDGGDDGLDSYRRLVPEIADLLRQSGVFIFEIGHDQDEAVSSLLYRARLRGIQGHQDLSGHVRCLSGRAD